MQTITGISLMETLVSLFILTFFLLLFNAYELQIQREQKAAEMNDSAAIQIHSIAEQLKTGFDPSGAMQQWNGLLPGAALTIAKQPPFCRITLIWNTITKDITTPC